MTRTLWLNCAAGVAGDMLLAALVDAGASRLDVMEALGGLGVDGFAVTFEQVQRCGVRSTWLNVVVDDHGQGDAHEHPHRPASDVIALIDGADLPDRVKQRAIRVYRTLAEVEAGIHGMSADDVELHEVGALDSILDVVGVCAALESMGVERIVSGPIAVGQGTVETAHGTFPNPVPAVAELLALRNVPVAGIDTEMELATPTGVALVAVLADGFGPIPAMTVIGNGFGAGTADPPGRPNVVQAVIGEAIEPTATVAGAGRLAHLVEANVDDVTGEILAGTIAELMRAGAHDAWVTPIVMKKGRPAHTVHALCDDATLSTVADAMISETGTLGLRASTVERWPQHRIETTVNVDGHEIRVKVGAGRVKVEHDDAVAVSAALGRPVRDILRAAEQATSD